MKWTGIALSMALFPVTPAVAQLWCVPGATWYEWYQQNSFNGYNLYTYEGDTLVGGHQAKRISFTGHWYSWNTTPTDHVVEFQDLLTRVDNGILWQWHADVGQPEWDTLAWWSASPGDSWQTLDSDDAPCACTYTVTDTGHAMIAGAWLRYVETVSDCTFGPPTPTFYERIGSFTGAFPETCSAGAQDSVLRCYSDTGMTLITGIASACDLILGVAERGSDRLALHPNPGTDGFDLVLPQHFEQGTLTIMDVTGRACVQRPLNGSRPGVHRVGDLGHLPVGVYLIRLQVRNGTTWNARWVKE
ncbi:MAG: T9SS type A sorting domain-containing protein [Flavobacteriales bacterium]|nr:T9SS type A sorting domain-containing protein [Flavobacteriales bacterium]